MHPFLIDSFPKTSRTHSEASWFGDLAHAPLPHWQLSKDIKNTIWSILVWWISSIQNKTNKQTTSSLCVKSKIRWGLGLCQYELHQNSSRNIDIEKLLQNSWNWKTPGIIIIIISPFATTTRPLQTNKFSLFVRPLSNFFFTTPFVPSALQHCLSCNTSILSPTYMKMESL